VSLPTAATHVASSRTIARNVTIVSTSSQVCQYIVVGTPYSSMAEQQHNSLRYLRLQHDFQTMIKTGLSCVDEEVCCISCTAAQARCNSCSADHNYWDVFATADLHSHVPRSSSTSSNQAHLEAATAGGHLLCWALSCMPSSSQQCWPSTACCITTWSRTQAKGMPNNRVCSALVALTPLLPTAAKRVSAEGGMCRV
jgi:hypothetical protein